MSNFADRLTRAINEKKSCVVVGLDPRINQLPPELRERAERSLEDAADAVVEFNREVIAAIAPHSIAVKPQVAFYEALGWHGYRAFARTIELAHEKNLLVISDVKRGDIGSTAEAYAKAHLDVLDSDAVTVNPYCPLPITSMHQSPRHILQTVWLLVLGLVGRWVHRKVCI